MPTLIAAPKLRGSFKDSLPSDLRELATWLNRRLPDRQRPRCLCGERKRVVYVPNNHALWWGCPRQCSGVLVRSDEERLYAYAAKRLRHAPKDCVAARTA